MRYIRYIKSQFNILSEVFSGAITHGRNAISIIVILSLLHKECLQSV